MTTEEESVFDIVERLVQPVAVIAEMMKIGDADQERHHRLAKTLLASLLDLGEEIDQSLLDDDESAETREKFAAEASKIIYGLRDYLSASATAIYDRQSNMAAMDTFSDTNATAIFITKNQFNYAINHEPTVRKWQNKVNLEVVTRAARRQKPSRVQALINALEDGLNAG